jgi:hypothetical protein
MMVSVVGRGDGVLNFGCMRVCVWLFFVVLFCPNPELGDTVVCVCGVCVVWRTFNIWSCPVSRVACPKNVTTLSKKKKSIT